MGPRQRERRIVIEGRRLPCGCRVAGLALRRESGSMRRIGCVGKIRQMTPDALDRSVGKRSPRMTPGTRDRPVGPRQRKTGFRVIECCIPLEGRHRVALDAVRAESHGSVIGRRGVFKRARVAREAV